MSDNAGATRRTVRWLLSAQLMLALGLILVDLAPSLPSLVAPSQQPARDLPPRPGDQPRRYRPRDPANPRPRVTPAMPRRPPAGTTDIHRAPRLSLRGPTPPRADARNVTLSLTTPPSVMTHDRPG